MTIYQFQEYLLQNGYIESITHGYKELVYMYIRDDIHIYVYQTYSDKTIYFIEIYNMSEIHNFNGYEYSDYTLLYNTLIYIERECKLNLIATI